MLTVIILSPYTGEGTDASPYCPLVGSLFPNDQAPFLWVDITEREMSVGIPSKNMYVLRAVVSQDEYDTIFADDRFFIVDEIGYDFATADLWMTNRGFGDHPVVAEDSALEARDKIIGYFRAL